MRGYLLDTDIVSEGISRLPHPALRDWVERQVPQSLFISSTVIAEIRAGIEVLPDGRRRAGLDDWCASLIKTAFVDRILVFDQAAALAYGRLVAGAKRAGRPAHVADAQIAAVAAVHDLTVATRDIADFAGFAVPLVNPFEGA